MARGCLEDCSYKLESHTELSHLCNSESNHKCTEFCSVIHVGCNKQCDKEFEHQLQQKDDVHSCGERQCVQKCRYSGCSRRCANKDHLHDLYNCDSHLCDKQLHNCDKTCNVQGGRCPGLSGASVNPCVVAIDDSEISHKGLHYCGKIHLFDKRCPCCDAFCNKELVSVKDGQQHITEFKTQEGLCNTNAHQTAKKLTIENSLGYTEASCEGECCGHVCGHLGRGHLHLVLCKADANICTHHHTYNASGQRLDQVLHATFWKHFAHFEDPCQDKQLQEIFGMCPMYCSSKQKSEKDPNTESFCQEKLWHEDIRDADANTHVMDGHQFGCRHDKHVILVSDCSASMYSSMNPKSTSQHAELLKLRRLDMVTDATINFLKQLNKSSSTYIASVVAFSTYAQVITARANLTTVCETLTNPEWTKIGRAETRYFPAIEKVKEIL